MYIKVLSNIKNNQNNKKGGVWVQGSRFDPIPSQVGEKDKKRKKKSKKKMCSERDLNPRPSDHKSCT